MRTTTVDGRSVVPRIALTLIGLCWAMAACGGADTAPRGRTDHDRPSSLVVASVFPATIHAGDRIIVTGSGFSKSFNQDTVLVDGAAAIVTAATDSDITAIAPSPLPCSAAPSGTVTIAVAAAGRTVAPHSITSAASHPLAVGQATLLGAADAACTALTGGGAAYVITVYSANTAAFPQSAPFIITAASTPTSFDELASASPDRLSSPSAAAVRTMTSDFTVFGASSDVPVLEAGLAYARARAFNGLTLRAYRDRARRAGMLTSAAAPGRWFISPDRAAAALVRHADVHRRARGGRLEARGNLRRYRSGLGGTARLRSRDHRRSRRHRDIPP